MTRFSRGTRKKEVTWILSVKNIVAAMIIHWRIWCLQINKKGNLTRCRVIVIANNSADLWFPPKGKARLVYCRGWERMTKMREWGNIGWKAIIGKRERTAFVAAVSLRESMPSSRPWISCPFPRCAEIRWYISAVIRTRVDPYPIFSLFNQRFVRLTQYNVQSYTVPLCV